MGGKWNDSEEEAFHVLTVDDSLVDRKIMERLLKNFSYQVTSVDSVRKALQFLGLEDDKEGVNVDKMKVNMIITDYSMPELTGYDLLRRVKESSRLKDIPVVITSSENVDSRISRFLSDGAQQFMLKPVQLSDVEKLRFDMVDRRGSDRDQHQSASNKRKYVSDSLLPQSEKRGRLTALTVP